MTGVRLLVGVVFAGNALVFARPQTPAFRATADSVRVDVAVLDRGRPVTGLAASDFVLLDNGTPQEIADFSREQLPIDVTIALDISASVRGDVLEQLRRSVQQLRADLRTNDRLKLLTFNMRIKRILDFGAPASATDEALAGIRAFGSTALLDTIAVSLAVPAVAGRRQLVVLFTDGEDSNSVTDQDLLFDVVRRTTPTLDLVLASARLISGVVTTPATPTLVARTQFLTALARESGGTVESVDAGENLSARFRRLLADFRASYVMHFVPRGVERTGVHTIDVTVKRSGLSVRARRAYSWR
jgi:VWFA-related protein